MANYPGGGSPPQGPYPGQMPPPAGAPWPAPGMPGGPVVENTSGQKGPVPPEVGRFKWHWGAFGLSWIWAFNHGLPIWGILLLILWLPTLVPVLGLVWFILYLIPVVILALKGHGLAWQRRHYPGGFPQYMQVENTWSTAGMILFIVWAVGVVPFTAILAAILFPVFAKAREKAREEAGQQGACIQKHVVAHMASASLRGTYFTLPSGVSIRG